MEKIPPKNDSKINNDQLPNNKLSNVINKISAKDILETNRKAQDVGWKEFSRLSKKYPDSYNTYLDNLNKTPSERHLSAQQDPNVARLMKCASFIQNSDGPELDTPENRAQITAALSLISETVKKQETKNEKIMASLKGLTPMGRTVTIKNQGGKENSEPQPKNNFKP